MRSYFSRTATPRQRIEIWLDNIETSARSAQADCDRNLDARQSKADAALARYAALQSLSGAGDDSEELSDAARKVSEALNAVRPPVWLTAREALINAALVRDALARNVADEAVEASLRAVNAWWRMRTLQFEKQMLHGFEGIKARQKGGKKRATRQAEENARRDARLRQSYQAILRTKLHSQADIIRLLASRSGLSTRQIRRIVLRADIN
jgi:hypothetical protein